MDKEEILKELEKEQRKIEELKKQVKNMPDDKPVKRWRNIAEGGYYFYIGENGLICRDKDTFHKIDNFKHNIGNYFKTEEEAERHRENLINKQKLKDLALELNNGIAIDWDNTNQKKWVIKLHENKTFSTFEVKYQGMEIYCLDSDFEDKAIELIGEDKLIQLIKDGE